MVARTPTTSLLSAPTDLSECHMRVGRNGFGHRLSREEIKKRSATRRTNKGRRVRCMLLVPPSVSPGCLRQQCRHKQSQLRQSAPLWLNRLAFASSILISSMQHLLVPCAAKSTRPTEIPQIVHVSACAYVACRTPRLLARSLVVLNEPVQLPVSYRVPIYSQ